MFSRYALTLQSGSHSQQMHQFYSSSSRGIGYGGGGQTVDHERFLIIIIINTSNNWSRWNSNEKPKEKFGSCTRKTFDRFITKDSYTWNITHNTESTAV